MSAIVIVEGGTNSGPAVREAFARLYVALGLKGRMPRTRAAGSRNEAFKDFEDALAKGEAVLLLVDSEHAPTGGPWEHVKQHDKWQRPNRAEDEHLQFMVRSTEAWLLRDHAALRSHFGPKIQTGGLPSAPERLAPQETASALSHAVRATPKAGYDKGRDTFPILGKLDPARLETEPWAKRFLDRLRGL